MTGRRRLRVCVHGVVQGVGFRPFVYTARGGTRPVRLGAQRQLRRRHRGRGRRRPTSTTFLDTAARPTAAAGRHRIDRDSGHPGRRRHRLRHRRHVTIGRRPHPGLPRRRHVRRLRGRTARPGRPALPARVRQLHQLRPAVHDHRLAALRPRRHDDGAPSRCAPTAPANTPTPPTAASTPSRSAARNCGPTLRYRDRDGRSTDGEDGAAPRPAAAARRRDPRGQGHRRLPPGLRRRATSARWPSCARASDAATSRSR